MKIYGRLSCLKAANVVNRFVSACSSNCTSTFRFLQDTLIFEVVFLNCTRLSGDSFATIRSLSCIFGISPTCYSNSRLDFVCEFSVPFVKKEVHHD